jgi:uncharacterized protein (TIGR00255 family)
MIRSMTAYGRSLRLSSLGKCLVEVHSVNKKTLDFNVHAPREFLQFDLDVRKWLSAKLKRGQITVRISFYPNSLSGFGEGHLECLKLLQSEMKKACIEIGRSDDDLSFPFLYGAVKERMGHQSDVSSLPEDLLKLELEIGVQEALDACVKMKEEEGLILKNAFENHLIALESLVKEVEKDSDGIEEKYRKKIEDKLQEFKEVSKEDKDRVLREVFLYAEKVDITEEIVRLHSHIGQFRKIFSSEESVGRTMDFLIQEMGREVNTISSKAEGLSVSYSALKMKGEIEKMKEQAQNIE